jgi:hypothetical protein
MGAGSLPPRSPDRALRVPRSETFDERDWANRRL